jgi:hypothetical protein
MVDNRTQTAEKDNLQNLKSALKLSMYKDSYKTLKRLALTLLSILTREISMKKQRFPFLLLNLVKFIATDEYPG